MTVVCVQAIDHQIRLLRPPRPDLAAWEKEIAFIDKASFTRVIGKAKRQHPHGALDREVTMSDIAINVPYPETTDLHLLIRVGACRLRIEPGEGADWVTGTYHDPSDTLACKVIQDGATVRITQEENVAALWGLFGGVPSFDLSLGKARPHMLTVETGASENALDLGGVPITRLAVKQGAAKMEIDFSAPNPQSMSTFDVRAGAGAMELRNLANANFGEMRIEGGAASYNFDFGGALQQNALVRIETGISSVDISVPTSTAAKISPETVLGGLDIGDGFTKKEGAFWTAAALAGNAPLLTIHASVSLGALRLRTT